MQDHDTFISKVLHQLLLGKSLSVSTAQKVFVSLLQQHLSFQEARSLLLLLAKKGESTDEIWGCLQAIRRMEPPLETGIADLVDTCGTGGDHSGSFNISTMAAIVVAGAGGHVAKHGNRSITSKCGSSDIMEALGVRLEASRGRMVEAIRKFGIGYFHAPAHHPVFSRIQPLRKALGVPTLFNLLGPLLNPLKLKYQLVGVTRESLLKIYPEILKKMKFKAAWVIRSKSGMDEITPASATQVIAIRRSVHHRFTISKKAYSFKPHKHAAYQGGNVRENKKTALRLLQNRLQGPLRDIVTANAGAVLHMTKKASTFQKGIVMAEESIASGAAMNSLQGLIRISKKS